MPLGSYRLNSLSRYFPPAGGSLNFASASSQYLTVPANADWAVGTGNFTIEWFQNFTAGGSQFPRIFSLGAFNAANIFAVSIEAGRMYVNMNATFVMSPVMLGYIGGWHHFALVRNGTALSLYQNGLLLATVTNSSNITNSTTTLSIGCDGLGVANTFFNGRITNFHWIKGTAKYTSEFTPPTSNITADANSKLLLLAATSGALLTDSSGTNKTVTNVNSVSWTANALQYTNYTATRPKTITALGTAQVSTAQSKFGGASALINANTGGSNVALSIPWDIDYRFGGFTNYTIEGWVYHTSWINRGATSGEGAFCNFVQSKSNGFVAFSFGFNQAGKIGFDYNTTGTYGGTTVLESGTSGVLNTWQHIAFVKQGNTYTCYVDGVSKLSTTITSFITCTDDTIRIGQNFWGANAYYDEVRYSKVARYTSNFTPATSTFLSDSNTVLLLHADGANASTTFTDDTTAVRTAKTVTANGNAQVSTTQSRFGGASALFDGTGDYLTVSPVTDFAFGTNNCTIEFWVRFNNTSTAILFDTRPASTQGNYTTIYWTGSTIRFYASGSDRITSTNLSTSVWYHVALVNSGNSWRLYINGTQSGSTFTTAISWLAGQCVIGADAFSIGTSSLNGNIDEIRVSNSARYTSAFTSPSNPLVNDSNTLLLIHANGTNGSTTFTDDIS